MKTPKKYAIVTPCFNEEQVLETFLGELEQVLQPTEHSFVLIVVDDASSDKTFEIIQSFTFDCPNLALRPIRLKYNMGHQEAIRQGLSFANGLSDAFEAVFVMDSDGEDDPNAIVRMIEMTGSEIVFVERGKRSESWRFKLGYAVYRFLFKMVTGRSISFGNFSKISQPVLQAVANQKFFHFASFLSKQKYQIAKVKYDRRKRIDGKSKMNYKSLVFHGLYSFVEFAEEILFTLIKFFVLVLLIVLGIAGYVIYAKLVVNIAIPGWASTLSVNLAIMSLISLSTVVLGLILLSIKRIILQKDQAYDEVR